jgi:glutamyl-tRNA synthetase
MRTSRANSALSGWICSSCERRLQAGQAHPQRPLLPKRHNSTKAPSFRKVNSLPGSLRESPARTRFAPSPTGNLHLGSIRTALYNYLLARRTKGQFLLRIEDTDQKRTVPGAEERLFEDLRWAGLQWDEGPVVGGQHGPYRQSERIYLYQDHVKPLLQNGKAYRCFCSSERIGDLYQSRQAKGLPLGYDRKCADIPPAEAEDQAHNGESHVIRFLTPKEYPTYFDLVYGKSGHGAGKTKRLLVDEPAYDDPILIKSDGFPTYHFANVVDDHLMKITHVIRGSEWMASTPLHVALYEAFEWIPPSFVHTPLLVDANYQKLSKRNIDTDVASFRNKGTFPEALTNFAVLLGWSHKEKTDVMDLSHLEKIFNLKITKGNTIVSLGKLEHLQRAHAHRRIEAGGEPFEQMIRDVAQALLDRYGAAKVMSLIGKRKLRDVVEMMLRASTKAVWINAQTFAEGAVKCLFDNAPLLENPPDISSTPSIPVAAASILLTPEEHWTADVHRANLRNIDLGEDTRDAKKSKAQLYHWLRWALVGSADGPGIPETMEILGRDVCVQRIQAANVVSRDDQLRKTEPDIKVEAVAQTDGDGPVQQ